MGLFDKFKNIFNKKEKEEVEAFDKGLEKTRNEFVNKIGLLNRKYKKVSNEYFEELEEILIMADIGVNTVIDFIDKLKYRVKHENIIDSEDLKEVIIDELFIIYVNNEIVVNKIKYAEEGPTVVLFVGVNGVGKTTTIAKLAHKYKEKGLLDELANIHKAIFACDVNNVRLTLETVTKIKGLGYAGASGLLALMYPDKYGTIDQFVVLALRKINDLPEKDLLERMDPNGLKAQDGVILIDIYRKKAEELKIEFNWIRVLSVYGVNDGENTLISYSIKQFLNNSELNNVFSCQI